MKIIKPLKLVLLCMFLSMNVLAENQKPYIMAFTSTESIAELKQKVATQLVKNGIQVLGQYQPAEDANRWVIAFGSEELDKAVQTVGGLTGFAAALRIGFTREDDKTLVSYTNPMYWGNAYFRTDFEKVSGYYTTLSKKIEEALYSAYGFVGNGFGSDKGFSEESLRKYHYMMGMPFFQNTVKLEKFDSEKQALDKIEANLKAGISDLEVVYQHHIPNTNLTLLGVGIKGKKGESHFLPIVDIVNPKYTAFLPYEILVMDNEVHMLHGRFRIALSFPDLTMGTFTKIISTPGDIESAFKQLVK